MLHSLRTDKEIYLDHAATTPMSAKVLEVVSKHMQEDYANPSSMHFLGRRAKSVLENSRLDLATILRVMPEEVVYTGSGTESNNLAILGVARANKRNGKHIIISAIEHKAVLAPASILEKEGFTITKIPVTEQGIVDTHVLKNSLRPETLLVSIMLANNEIGTIQPVKEVVDIVKNHRKNTGNLCFVHTDACQAMGLLPVYPKDLGVDLLSINGSKIYGPKGIGVLYIKKGIKISPVIFGGSQELGLRAGTENIAIAVGMSEAVKDVDDFRLAESARLSVIQGQCFFLLKKNIPNLIINGDMTKRLVNNVHICIPNIEGESLVLLLDRWGISTATGSACSSRDLEPSHVLKAIGRNDDIIHGSLRLSFGRSTTLEDVHLAVFHITEAVKLLTSMTATTTNIVTGRIYEKNT